jgi:hypothetical protein
MHRCLSVLLLASSAWAEVGFNRDIRPIMADTCFRCHGPDKSSRMAGLRLDVREEALKRTASGVTPIAPGDPDHSAILQRIFARDGRVMPPKFAHKDLTEAQKQTFRRWVAEGAKYEGHWSYQPLRRPAVPAGPAHPVDAFLEARLAREGLTPQPEADRRTLIRRVTLDLTGLPPAPAEVNAFLADRSPAAYAKLVDRLLASPRYAEKQAMYWLDAVRYADTCGFHGDNIFPAWPYRDYVLRAFRDNKPFDVFTREQFAGDLMPGATEEQRIASAFNRLNRTSAEGGVQPKEYLAKYAADRVRTTAAVWLATTVGCAECHDHKFDPIAARDFYSLKAVFADIKETGLVPDRGAKAWGSQIALATAAQQEKLARLEASLAAARARLDAFTPPAGWEKEALAAFDSGALAWRYQRPLSASATGGAALTVYNDQPVEVNDYDGTNLKTERKPGDGLVVVSGANPDNSTYTVTARPGVGTWTALGLEVVQDETLPGIRVSRGADRLVVTDVDIETAAGRRASFIHAASNVQYASLEFPAMGAIDGDAKTGWGLDTYGDNANLFLALRFTTPLATAADTVLTIRIRQESTYRRATIGRFRLALSSAHYAPPVGSDRPRNSPVLKALRAAPEKRSEADRKALADFYRFSAPAAQPALVEVARIESELSRLRASIPRVVVTEAATPEPTRILPRGNFLDETGPIVEPAIPAVFGKLATGGRRATRLDLANWLVSPENPLTARAYANRAWRQFFGVGISKTLDDLGSQGEWPVHPELLDWLASEFIEPRFEAGGAHAWDMRHLVRVIVTSAAYRRSSASTPQLEEKDPDNRLLARQSRLRVDAETVRDVALFASGLLAERFGGPSVRPYQPDGYLAALNFPKREYSASRGDDLYRRGLYTLWQRTYLHPSLLTFDAPTREECVISRVNSNTPLQALVLLNDPIYVEAARVFAQRLLARPAAERIDAAFERTLSRKPTAEERRILLGLYRESLARFRAAPAAARDLLAVGDAPRPKSADAAELAATAVVTRAVLNLHETITRN